MLYSLFLLLARVHFFSPGNPVYDKEISEIRVCDQ